MENNTFQEEQEVQKLQERILELERQLVETQAVIQALSSSRGDTLQIEDAQQRAEELHAVIQTLHDPVMVYDQNGVIYMSNASAIRAHGFDPTWHHRQDTNQTLLIRSPNGEITHSNDLPSARALRGETVIDEALMITNSRGQELSILVTSSPLMVNGVRKGAVSVWHDITERKRTEEALRISEAKYRSLVETAFEGVWAVDTTGRTTFINRRMVEMLQYDSPNDLMERSAFDFVPEEDLENVKANFRMRLSKSSPEQYDVRLRRRDGSIIWVSAAANNILDEHGNIIGRMALFIDITERKQVEERLRSARDEAAWLARLPGEDPNPIMRVSNTGVVLYCNPMAASLQGWRCMAHKVLSRPLIDLVEQAVEQGQMVEQDIFLNGRFYAISAIPIPEEGYLNLYGRDITERKQAENALAESERRQREITRLLELDQARLAAVLRYLPVGVWIVDQQGRLTGNNPEADRIWAGEAPLLNSVDDYQKYLSWHPESGELLRPEEYPVAIALRTGALVDPIELKIRRFDGSKGTVLASAAPIKDNLGRLMGVVGVNVDITERKKFEIALRKRESILAQAEEMAHLGAWDIEIENQDDLNVNPLTWSDEVYRIFGYAPGEVTPSNDLFFERVHPNDRVLVQETIAQAIATRQPYTLEHRICRPDGEVRVVQEHAEIFFNESGKPARIVGAVQDITERKRAEDARREGELRLKRAQEIAHLGSWELDLLNNRLTWSDEVYRIFGLQPQEFKATYEAFLEAVHPDDRAAVDAAYTESIQAGKDSYEIEHRVIKRSSGEVRIVHEKCEHFRNQDGEIIRSIGMVHDITERKKAEEALREAEIKYRTLVEHIPNAVTYMTSPDPTIGTFYVSPQIESMLGYTVKEWQDNPRSWYERIHPEDREHLVASNARHENSGEPFSLEYRLMSRDGRTVWVRDEAVMIPASSGKPLLSQGIMIDITERKKAENALRRSEERFHSLADSMPQLVWTALPDGTVDYYNQRYLEYQEIKEGEGATWEWAPVLHPDDLQPTVNAWKHSVETGEIYQIEHRVRMADGSYRWHLSRGVPMLDENGRVIQWFGTATDIHDLKLAEEELKVYAGRLERSNRELEQFAFMASHDLQEPLRKIEMFGDLLLKRATGLNESEREYLDRIRDAANRMRDMVKGLLELSRVNTQGKPFVTVDLSQVASEVLADFENKIRRIGGKVDVEPLPTVEGDPVQLRQLFQNLIGNALKYHKPEAAPEVSIYARQLPGKAQIHVEDHGIGFAQKDAERIFQPFQRLVGRSEYEGSGIGLAICRRIVERHLGEIVAFSQPGQGSTFVITLPSGRSKQ